MLNEIVKRLREACESNWPTPSPSDNAIWLMLEAAELVSECARVPDFLDVEPTRNNPRTATFSDIEREAADVLVMLVSLLNDFNVNLLDAFGRGVLRLYYTHAVGYNDLQLQQIFTTEVELYEAEVTPLVARMFSEVENNAELTIAVANCLSEHTVEGYRKFAAFLGENYLSYYSLMQAPVIWPQ